MSHWQLLLLIAYGFVAFIGFLKALYLCRSKKSAYGHTDTIFNFYGAFVWADLVVFGLFWSIVSLFCLITENWILFLLSLSVFWLIRSFGETLYWFHQQFTPRGGNEPEKFWFHKIVLNDSVYFVNQIYWQCVTVVTLITTLYLAKLWLSS